MCILLHNAKRVDGCCQLDWTVIASMDTFSAVKAYQLELRRDPSVATGWLMCRKAHSLKLFNSLIMTWFAQLSLTININMYHRYG